VFVLSIEKITDTTDTYEARVLPGQVVQMRIVAGVDELSASEHLEGFTLEELESEVRRRKEARH
jgi:hypothetical protein